MSSASSRTGSPLSVSSPTHFDAVSPNGTHLRVVSRGVKPFPLPTNIPEFERKLRKYSCADMRQRDGLTIISSVKQHAEKMTDVPCIEVDFENVKKVDSWVRKPATPNPQPVQPEEEDVMAK